MKLVPTKVRRNTALNPVARAVARQKLRQAILDQKIQLYLLEEGAPCAAVCFMIAQMLSALVEAAAIDKRVGTDNTEVRLLRGAISACEQMISTDKFVRLNIVALERGLDVAQELVAKLAPEAFNAAWNAKPRYGA